MLDDAAVTSVKVRDGGAVCVSVCVVGRTGVARSVGLVTLSVGSSETSASEPLAVGDSLLLLSSVSSVGSSVAGARTGSAVSWMVVVSAVSVVKRAAVRFKSVREPLSVGQ